MSAEIGVTETVADSPLKNNPVSFVKALNLSSSDRETALRAILKVYGGNNEAEKEIEKEDLNESGGGGEEELTLPASEIGQHWRSFLAGSVPKKEWLAVWIQDPDDTDSANNKKFVDVISINYPNMKAYVSILMGGDEEDSSGEQDEIEVPLLELYPILDSENLTTSQVAAHSLDHCRFFYRYIWRPWDEDDDTDDWISDHLSHRVALYEEYKQLGEFCHTWSKFECLGFEYQELVEEKGNIQNRQDSDLAPRSSDVAELMEIEDKMSSIKLQALKIQDPEIRMACVLRKQNKRRLGREPGPYVHVVVPSKEVKQVLEYVAVLGGLVDSELPSKTHRNVWEAIDSAISGDIVVVPEGDHAVEDLGELNTGGILIGIGSQVNVMCKVKYDTDLAKLQLQNVQLLF